MEFDCLTKPQNRKASHPKSLLPHYSCIQQKKEVKHTDVIQMFPDYAKRAAEIAGNPHLQALQDVEENIVRPALTTGRLHYRYGGSFSAYFQGGKRIPQDIDIEMNNGANVIMATNILARQRGAANVYREPTGLCGLVTFPSDIDAPNVVSCDIVDENNGRFNEVYRSPDEMGERFKVGDLSTPARLIINYLDRMIRTPTRSKNDSEQIMGIYGHMLESSTGEYSAAILKQQVGLAARNKVVSKVALKELDKLMMKKRVQKTKETPDFSSCFKIGF